MHLPEKDQIRGHRLSVVVFFSPSAIAQIGTSVTSVDKWPGPCGTCPWRTGAPTLRVRFFFQRIFERPQATFGPCTRSVIICSGRIYSGRNIWSVYSVSDNLFRSNWFRSKDSVLVLGLTVQRGTENGIFFEIQNGNCFCISRLSALQRCKGGRNVGAKNTEVKHSWS
jgi:hypothetical protein